MPQLQQTFLTFGLVLEPHDIEKMFDSKFEKNTTAFDSECRSRRKKVTTESRQLAQRSRRPSRLKQQYFYADFTEIVTLGLSGYTTRGSR